MTSSLRGLGMVAAVALLCACGSSSAANDTRSTTGSGTDQGPPPAADDPMVQEGMVVANALRDEYVALKNAHEAAWQERIEISTGPDLNTIGPRYATVSADFNARAEQAWQSMNAAVGQLHQHRVDPFRQLINQSRAHVAVMRQMVEAIQGELMEMRSAAAPVGEVATDGSAGEGPTPTE